MKKIVIIAVVIVSALILGLLALVFMERSNEEKNENKSVKVGLIMSGCKDDNSWNRSHYDGICKTAAELDLDILCREDVTSDAAPEIINELVEENCEIIIANSLAFEDAVSAASSEYPQVFFYQTSGTDAGNNLESYFGRMYQIRYLTGIAAGMQTKTNEIGYIAAFPVSEVNRGINAFTLGVRSVNPDAQVYVCWINSWDDDEASAQAAEKLVADHNIDILSMHTDSVAPLDVAQKHGIMSIGYNFDNCAAYPESCLTCAVWDWEKYYTPHLKKCIGSKFEGICCWEGLDTEIVKMTPLCAAANKEINQKTADVYEKLQSGIIDVFYGPIYDNEGNLRIAEGESMTDEAMLNEFDWYVEGVVIDE